MAVFKGAQRAQAMGGLDPQVAYESLREGLGLSVVHDCRPEEVAPFRRADIPPDVYFYKYSAIGGDTSYRTHCITLRDKNTDSFIGFCGASPVRAQRQFKPMVAYWTCDLFVVPEYRGKRLADLLYSEVEESKPLLMGLGTSDLAYPIKLRRSWQPSHELEVYFYRLRAQRLKQIPRKLYCYFKQNFSLNNPDHEYLYRMADRLELSRVDELWDASREDYPNIVIRDADYIAWRYLKTPCAAKYRFITATSNVDGSYKALIVVSVLDNNLQIVDYLGPRNNKKVKTRLLTEALRMFPNVDSIRCMTSCPSLKSCLESFGFYRYKRRPRFTLLSSDGDSQQIANNWFVMMGDSDGEHIESMASYQDAARKAKGDQRSSV